MTPRNRVSNTTHQNISDGPNEKPPVRHGRSGGNLKMGPGGLEPPTSPLSGVRSSQLSYEPGFRIHRREECIHLTDIRKP